MDHIKSKQQQDKTIERKTIDDIQQLAKNIRIACEKNRVTYKKIIKQNPIFSLELYNPPIHLNTNKHQINITKQILIQQLDRLLDQQTKLQRQLNKLQVKQQEENFAKELELNKEANHFMFLRNVWKRPIYAIQAQDRVQKLNKSVALIKGHIINELKNQQSISNSNIDLNKYEKLRQNNQRLMMEKQDLRQMQTKYNNLVNSQNRFKNLEHQNDNLKNQLKQYKEKLINSERQNLKNKIKISELEQALLKKSRQSPKVNKNPQIVYYNPQYEIRINSKLIEQPQQNQIQTSLQCIIQLLSKNKANQIIPNPDRIPLIGFKNEQPILSTVIKKTHQHYSSTPQRSKRFKSNSDKINVEDQMRKTRFIRTRKQDQNHTAKEIIQNYMMGINLASKSISQS